MRASAAFVDPRCCVNSSKASLPSRFLSAALNSELDSLQIMMQIVKLSEVAAEGMSVTTSRLTLFIYKGGSTREGGTDYKGGACHFQGRRGTDYKGGACHFPREGRDGLQGRRVSFPREGRDGLQGRRVREGLSLTGLLDQPGEEKHCGLGHAHREAEVPAQDFA